MPKKPAGGGGGGPNNSSSSSSSSASASPPPHPKNTRRHLLRTKSRLPENTMRHIASFLPNDEWWVDVLRSPFALGYTFDRFLLHPSSSYPEVPGPLLDAANRTFRGSDEVLEAYLAYLRSDIFKKIYGDRTTYAHHILLKSLLCKVMRGSFTAFKIMVDELDRNKIDPLTIVCGNPATDPAILYSILQPSFIGPVPFENVIYLLEHSSDPDKPLSTPDPKVPFKIREPRSVMQVITRHRDPLGMLYLLLRTPNGISEEEYAALRYTPEAMKAALKRLFEMVVAGEIRRPIVPAIYAPEGERFRGLVIKVLGAESAKKVLMKFKSHRARQAQGSILRWRRTKNISRRKAYMKTLKSKTAKKSGSGSGGSGSSK